MGGDEQPVGEVVGMVRQYSRQSIVSFVHTIVSIVPWCNSTPLTTTFATPFISPLIIIPSDMTSSIMLPIVTTLISPNLFITVFGGSKGVS